MSRLEKACASLRAAGLRKEADLIAKLALGARRAVGFIHEIHDAGFGDGSDAVDADEALKALCAATGDISNG